MRIGIDVRMIFDFPTGIGNYRKNLIEALFEIDHENEYVLIGNKSQQTAFSDQLQKDKVSFTPIKSRANHPQQHLLLRKELKDLDLDVFWTNPWGAILNPPCKMVLTIHDLIYHHYPEFGSWKSKLYELFLEKMIANKADMVVTISGFVKKDIVEILGVNEAKVLNLSESVSSDYRVMEDNQFIEKVLEKYGLILSPDKADDDSLLLQRRVREDLDKRKSKNPPQSPFCKGGSAGVPLGVKYFVYLGNQRPHKNLVMLLKAFERFQATPLNPLLSGEQFPKLVIIGGVDSKGRDGDSLRIREQLEKMKYRDDVLLLGKVFDNNEVAAIFNRAIAMVHPSMHEGFGMTPLEAMRCACPVISSNVTAMPEVVGDAGILVNPTNEEEISDAMYEVFTNSKLRKDLSQKSLKQSTLFSWEKTARLLLDVFKKLS